MTKDTPCKFDLGMSDTGKLNFDENFNNFYSVFDKRVNKFCKQILENCKYDEIES